MNTLITAFLIFLPAGLANMVPVLANNLPGLRHWNTPLDFGKKYKDKRIFGDSKTWRGLIAGTLAAGLAGWALFVFTDVFAQKSLSFALVAAMAAGFGALLGDAVESFFKRRRGVKPGERWFPFDQTDYIIGGLVFYSPFIGPSMELVAAVFVIYFGLHLLFSYIGYLLGLKTTPI